MEEYRYILMEYQHAFVDWFSQLRLLECQWMNQLQTHFKPHANLLKNSAHYCHPTIPYVVLFPFFFLFNRHLSVKVLWAVSICEYLNTVLKWLFSDHRPYWWIKEYALQNPHLKHKLPVLLQFPETCETGPGFPSGHVMITVAVWWLIVNEIVLKTLKGKRILQAFSFLFVFIYIGLVVIGRLYISAHFPDQVLFGLIAGILTGIYLEKQDFQSEINLLKKFAVASLFTFTFAHLLTRGLQLLSFNPNWTLAMAKKHCFNSKFAKADTTPAYIIWKVSGTLLGAGIAFDLLPRLTGPVMFKRNQSPSKIIQLICCILLASFTYQLMEIFTPQPTNGSGNSMLVFYLLVYVQFFMLTIAVYFIGYTLLKWCNLLFV